MQARPLLALAALAAATEPDLGKDALARLKSGLRERYAADPMTATATAVLAAGLLFYRAERRTNPKISSVYDALVYVSTNLSVGHSDVTPCTTEGKAIASALMTFGPAVAAGALGEPAEDKRRAAASRAAEAEAITLRLDRILAALERPAAEPG